MDSARVGRHLNEAIGGRSYILAGNSVNDIIWGRSKEFCNDGKLVDMVLSGEERLAIEHLGKDAACTPNVHLDVVFLPCEHDLGGAVVSGGDIACHLGILDAGKTEIANLEVTVFVDENIAGLQVTVDDAG